MKTLNTISNINNINSNEGENMENLTNTCAECGTGIIATEEFCSLCKPHMITKTTTEEVGMKDLLNSLEINVAQLAEEVGYSKSTIYKVLNGKGSKAATEAVQTFIDEVNYLRGEYAPEFYSNDVVDVEQPVNLLDPRAVDQYIQDWHAANADCLAPVVVDLQEDRFFREAAAVLRNSVYNTGRRKSPMYNTSDNQSDIKSARYNDSKDWVIAEAETSKGETKFNYDDGGMLGEICGKASYGIQVGKANDSEFTGRVSLFEEGFDGRTIRVLDVRGNWLANTSTSGAAAIQAKEDATVRSLVADLEVRMLKRQHRKEVALRVMNELVADIKVCESYADIKDIINGSFDVLFAALKAECGTTFVADQCKYIKDGKEVTLNSWFLSNFKKKLWATVDESEWKKKSLAANDKKKAVYEKVQSLLDQFRTDNAVDLAETINKLPVKNSIGLTQEDARIATFYAKDNKDTARFSAPVFFALINFGKKHQVAA